MEEEEVEHTPKSITTTATISLHEHPTNTTHFPEDVGANVKCYTVSKWSCNPQALSHIIPHRTTTALLQHIISAKSLVWRHHGHGYAIDPG